LIRTPLTDCCGLSSSLHTFTHVSYCFRLSFSFMNCFISCSCFQVIFGYPFFFKKKKPYVFWYTRRGFRFHGNLLFEFFYIYFLNIPLTPSICSMPNACSLLSTSFRQHKYKGNVSSFLVFVDSKAVFTFAIILKITSLSKLVLIRIEHD
jgi:hypothetical protein